MICVSSDIATKKVIWSAASPHELQLTLSGGSLYRIAPSGREHAASSDQSCPPSSA
tara:strand:+ start:689 stop:856 length:168 start_codon:yes stop_codon:yes gene_type:complete